MDISRLKARELKEKLMARDLSSVEIVKAYLDRIEKMDGDINAFISLNDHAIKDAQTLDKRIKNGEENKVPFGLNQ